MAAVKKRAPSANLFAVLGTDESEVKASALKLADELSPSDAGEFGRDVIDGQVDNADQAAQRIHQTMEALLTLPFFGSKFVWLKNVNFLGDNVLGRAASVLEAAEMLGELLKKGLPENVTFLLSATEVDKRRSFYKTLGSVAKVEVLDKLDASRSGWEEDAASAISKRAGAFNLHFASGALELLALSTGGESRQIGNELEKLDLYLGDGRRVIEMEDVRLLVPLSRAGVIFELGNALARRDLRACFALVDRLLFQGESAIGIFLVAIVPTVRNLLIAKDLMGRHRLSRPSTPFSFISALNRLPSEATSHLPRKKDGTVNGFAFGIAASHVHRFELEELTDLFSACLDANAQLVTTQMDVHAVLDQLLGRLSNKRKD